MADALSAVIDELTSDPSNAWARDLGYDPVWAGAPSARIAIIGQAPGRRAQESGIPWDDASGVRLRSWLGVNDDEFYNPALFAIVPMDFYFPGRARRVTCPRAGTSRRGGIRGSSPGCRTSLSECSLARTPSGSISRVGLRRTSPRPCSPIANTSPPSSRWCTRHR